MVMIAHRLSTLAHCDSVIVMDAGRVVERGSYAELAARDDGHFKQMLAEQGIVAADEGGAAGAPPRQRQESEEATPRAEADSSLAKGAPKGDAVAAEKETGKEQSVVAAFVGSVRSACAVVMCDSKTTLFYFILSTVVGVVAMPMIMMSMLMQLMVLAVIYSDTNTEAIDATKWWIFFELMVAAAVIFFLGVFW
jgi:ABC-type transport system involved in Fe-S cluster assembly fused permease/ATPase subunit